MAARQQEEPTIHPDLAALFAAGDAVLPDHLMDGVSGDGAGGTVPAKDGDDDNRGGSSGAAGCAAAAAAATAAEGHLATLLTQMYRHAIDRSNAEEEKPLPPPRPGGVDDGASDRDDDGGAGPSVSMPDRPKQLLTHALGEALSWTDDDTDAGSAVDSDHENVSRMLLRVDDFPAMRRGVVHAKIGNALPLPGAKDAEFMVDRHRPFCGHLLEISTELTNFWGAAPAVQGSRQASVAAAEAAAGFPMYVRDFRYIFETADDASLYYKRSWRYLTENWIPDLPPPPAALPPTEAIYARVYKERVPLPDGIGSEAVAFKMPAAGAARTIRGKEGIVIGASIIAVFRVGSVVAKTYIASRDERLPPDVIKRGLASASRRMEQWCAAKSTPAILKALPPDVRCFRDEFITEWRAGVEAVLAWPKPPKSTDYGVAPCQVCKEPGAHKRCSGCRGFTYCGAACQKRHWVNGHKKECTAEFVTALSADLAKRKKTATEKS